MRRKPRPKSRRPRPKPEPSSVALGIRNWRVPLHSHVSYLWASPAELQEVAGFLVAGLRANDHALLVGSSGARREIASFLAERGFDVGKLQAAGRITQLGGAPSAKALLDEFEAAFEQAAAAGAPLIRLLGVPGWGEQDWPDDASLLSLEERFSGLARRYPSVTVCVYDARSLPKRILERAGFDAHPFVIAGGKLIDEAHPVAKDAFLASVTHAASSGAKRKRAEKKAEAALERLRAIQSITDSAVVHSTLDAMLQELLARLRHALHADFTIVLLVDEERQMLYPRVIEGPVHERMALMRIPMGKGVSGRVAQTGQPVIVDDLSTFDFVSGIDGVSPVEMLAVVKSSMAAPLKIEGKVIGVVAVGSARPRRFTQEELELLLLVADRAAPAVERGRLMETLHTAHGRLEALSRRLVQVQEAERAEIARELHDEVGQLLTGLGLMIGAGEPDARRDEMGRIVDELIGRVRDLSMSLRPPMLDALGLLPALLWQIARFEAQTGIRVEFRHAGLDQRFPPDVEIATFRIVQEALTNVARHANVPNASVEVTADRGRLRADVEDKGRGFDVETALTASSSGLAGMRERCRLLGGNLTIRSVLGAGTRLRVELPLQPATRDSVS